MNKHQCRGAAIGFGLAMFAQASAQDRPHPPQPSTSDHTLEDGEIGKSLEFDLPGGETIVMRYCPGETFLMGSPEQETGRHHDELQTEAMLRSHYWMAETECTQAQWLALMEKTHGGLKKMKWPVVVSWNEAQWFVSKLNEEIKPPSGWRWSLPSEVQWEHACRAGTKTRFSHGDDPALENLANYAWYDGNSNNEAHPVGEKLANPWGFHDMHGNMWEWCQDWYRDRSVPSGKNPPKPARNTEPGPLLRGGGWRSGAMDSRSARRSTQSYGVYYSEAGFRVVLTRSQVVSRTVTKTAKSEFEIPGEVVAFVEQLIREDPEIRARHAQFQAPVAHLSRFSPTPFSAIEWFVPETSWRFGGDGGYRNYEGVYLVRQPLRASGSKVSWTMANIVAQVTVKEDKNYERIPKEEGKIVLLESKLTLRFDGFVDVQLNLERATSPVK